MRSNISKFKEFSSWMGAVGTSMKLRQLRYRHMVQIVCKILIDCRDRLIVRQVEVATPWRAFCATVSRERRVGFKRSGRKNMENMTNMKQEKSFFTDKACLPIRDRLHLFILKRQTGGFPDSKLTKFRQIFDELGCPFADFLDSMPLLTAI